MFVDVIPVTGNAKGERHVVYKKFAPTKSEKVKALVLVSWMVNWKFWVWIECQVDRCWPRLNKVTFALVVNELVNVNSLN